MKENYGFIEFETIDEFKDWLDSQNVKRNIDKLQVHHTAAPSYQNWPTDTALRRQYNIKSFHIKNNGWGDIAQHLTIFPDGHIVTGRDLEKTPIGIKGWNTGAICIETYGNFDIDDMNDLQKKSVIAVYALFSKKFNIEINSNKIRPHCWFTASGTYLGDYVKSKSCKTCPGTKFMGFGNTKKDFEKFYELVRSYKHEEDFKFENGSYNKVARVKCKSNLNVRGNRPNTEGELAPIIDTVANGKLVTLGYVYNNWGSIFYDNKHGFVNVNYLELIE